MTASAANSSRRRARHERPRVTRRVTLSHEQFMRELRSAREWLVCALLHGLMFGLFASYAPDVALRAKATTLFASASQTRLPILEYQALRGDWDINVKAEPDGSALAGVSGGVAYAVGDEREFGRKDVTVFLRPAGMDVPNGSPMVVWLCGDEALPPGWSGPLLDHAGRESRRLSNALCQRRISS